MAGHQGLDVLIGIAVALLLTWLILIALAIRRPTSKVVQLEAAYRQFSSSGVLPSRNRRLRLTLLLLALLVILNVVWLGLLLSRASDERVGQSSTSQSATPAGVSRAVVRHQPPTLGMARRRSIRPLSWKTQPTPRSPSKPFRSRVRIAVEEIPFSGSSAGRVASGWTSRYPRRPTSRGGSPLTLSLGSRVVTRFACWTPTPV